MGRKPISKGETISVGVKLDASLGEFLRDKRFELRIDKMSDLVRQIISDWATANGYVAPVAQD